MNKTRVLVALVCASASLRAGASSQWQMTELYSSQDGRVQFLELAALASGQERVAGLTLVIATTRGATLRTFTFPTDLPADSRDRRMLVGTSSFAALGFLRPDYVVPDNFFPYPPAS